MHELSLCVLCCVISLIRVQHNPKLSSAVQTPATLLTPCLGATDALLLCQTTVICDWASIDRATSLSSWDYSCDIIAVAQQHLLKDHTWLIPCLLSFFSSEACHGTSDQLGQSKSCFCSSTSESVFDLLCWFLMQLVNYMSLIGTKAIKSRELNSPDFYAQLTSQS